MRTSVGRPGWMSPSTPSTACWSSDARATSAPPDPRRGWGQCARTPDPCTTLGADADAQLVEQPRRHGARRRLALPLLEGGDGGSGLGARQAVDRAGVVGQRGQHALGVLDLGRVGRGRHVAVAAAPLLVDALALELLVQRLLLCQLRLGVAELLLRPLQLLLLLVPVVHARPEHAAEATDQGAAEDGGAVVVA